MTSQATCANVSDSFSARTVNLHVNVLHDVFKTAVAEELVPSNPVSGVERPKVPPVRWRILEPYEVPRLYNAFSDDRSRRVFLTFILSRVAPQRACGAALGAREPS